MEKGIIGSKVVTQIGFVVHDIEKTSQAFADFLGVEKPKWSWTDTYDKAHTETGGKPTKARAKLAFFKVGEQLHIELIEPDHEPSTWRAFLDANGEGVHHIAFEVRDMDDKIARLESNGMPLLQKGDYTGGRYAYMDTSGELKIITELLENFR